MARINIEDSLFKDARWWQLIINVGCQYKALGYLTRAWILAQENWIEHGGIPKKAWPEELNILIEVELAESYDNGLVYVKGSKRAFAWLEQRSKAGSVVSDKKLKQLSKIRAKKSERALNGSERALNGSEPLTLTLSPTLSPTLTLTPSSVVVAESATANFELRFNADYQNLAKRLEQENLLTPKLKRNLPKIFRAFEGSKKFFEYMRGVETSPAYRALADDTARTRYLVKTILNEAGIS